MCAVVRVHTTSVNVKNKKGENSMTLVVVEATREALGPGSVVEHLPCLDDIREGLGVRLRGRAFI